MPRPVREEGQETLFMVIVETTDINQRESIKQILVNYRQYHDGWEATIDRTGHMESYREYYYDVPSNEVFRIVSILHRSRNQIITTNKIYEM